MKHLLIDGDILVYRCGFACNDEPQHVCLNTVDKSIQNIIDKAEEQFHESCTYQIYLSGSTNFRNDIALIAQYKGNRAETEKPVHYDAIRDTLVSIHGAIVSENEEADDILGYTGYNDDECVICTVDKDLLMIPGTHFNWVKNKVQHVTQEEGAMFFLKQCLMGDTTDNIQGIPKVGSKRADIILSKATGYTTHQAYLEVLHAYHTMFKEIPMPYSDFLGMEMRFTGQYTPEQAIEDVLLETARLLWIRREPEELFTWELFNEKYI